MNQTSASSICLYGVSDSRKTTNLVEFAKFVKETTGGRTRLVSTETAGVDRVQPGVDAGLIEPFWLSLNPRAAIRKLSRGEWPVKDPKTGEIAVIEVKRTVMVNGKSYDKVDLANKYASTSPAEWTQIGGYAIEGTVSLAEAIIRKLVKSGQKIQQDVVGSYDEDGEQLAAAAPAHFGAAQQELLFLLNEAPKGLWDASGGRMKYFLITGHEAKGDDDKTKSTIYGVGTVGKAAVKSIPKTVGTLLHFEIDPRNKPDGSKMVWAYTQPHSDSENQFVLWDCKANLPAHPKIWDIVNGCKEWKSPDGKGKIKFEPGGRFELTFTQTIYDYMKFQAWAKAAVGAELAKQIAALEPVKAEVVAAKEAAMQPKLANSTATVAGIAAGNQTENQLKPVVVEAPQSTVKW